MRGIYKISSNTDKKASMRATAKIWGARASEHSFKFCEQLKIFYGPFITPNYTLTFFDVLAAFAVY